MLNLSYQDRLLYDFGMQIGDSMRYTIYVDSYVNLWIR